MTRRLTLDRFAAELLAFADGITAEERWAARRSLADALACAVVGAPSSTHSRSRSALAAFDREGRDATIWFTGMRAGVLTAAYLNSLAVSADDLDDGHRGAIGHPGGAVIPAVLAELELTGSTVDVLDAVVFGYEAALRIAEARDPARFERTATGRWASFAAAAVSCFIHGDSAGTLAHALAHAGSLAPQLSPPDPRAVDGLKEGTPWAVVAGLVAARLARAGIPGPTYLLERHAAYGLGGLERVAAQHPAAITQIYFKRYACCRWIHPVLDCVAALHEERALRPDEIEAVHVVTFERGLRLSNRPHPTTLEEAHYSFPFCIGLALTESTDALLPLRSEALASRPALDLAERVTLAADAVHDAAFPARTPGTVRIRATSGSWTMSVPTAFGDPSRPLDGAALRHKHRRLVGPRAPALVEPLARLLDADTRFDPAHVLEAISRGADPADLMEGP